MQFFTLLGENGENFCLLSKPYKEYDCHQDASFEPLTALIGPTHESQKKKKIDA